MRTRTVKFLGTTPSFGTKTRPAPISAQEKSPYYWWWQYLRRNKRYLGCCERGGGGQLSKLYRDFGDVRDDDFKSWWYGSDNRGAMLFAEQRADITIKELTHRDEWLPEFLDQRVAVIAVNLNLESNRAIKKQFDRWLKKQNQRSPGKPSIAGRSTAKYPLRANYSTPALKKILRVYDAVESANKNAKASGEKAKPMWAVGFELKLLPYLNGDYKLSEAQRLDAEARVQLSKTTSRYYKKAKETIAATSQGQFP